MPPPDRGLSCLPCAGHNPASCLQSPTITGTMLVGGKRNLPFSILFLSYQPFFSCCHRQTVGWRENRLSYTNRQGCSALAGETFWGPLVQWLKASPGEQRGDYFSTVSCTGAETGNKTVFPWERWERWKADVCEESIYSRWNKALREMHDWGWEGRRGDLAGRNTKFTGKASVWMLRQIATLGRMIPLIPGLQTRERCDRRVQICQRGVV